MVIFQAYKCSMNAACYYVAFHTGVPCTPDEYTGASGELANVVSETLGEANMRTYSDYESASVAIEVQMENGELVAKALIDLIGKDKPKLDKPKLPKIAKALGTRWPAMRVFKSAAPQEKSSSTSEVLSSSSGEPGERGEPSEPGE